ncbi:MAG TPA: hypothetical protein VFB79_09260 [Candidatus Angelobacter sp.]|nr:hypothetical protein [Candidatus Angelobacter sp.]
MAESQPALLIGASIASICSGLHLFYTAGGPLHDQYDKIIEIYITAITASLGLKAFYNQIAPITDVNILLKRVISDLNKTTDGQLWIVYPALNIGYYRNRKGIKQEREPAIIAEFSSAVKECAKRLTHTAHIVTYPTALYQPLFHSYIDKQPELKNESDDTKNKIAEECATNANNMATGFVQHVAEGLNVEIAKFDHTKNHHELSPLGFPQQVIIIGSVTYALLSYGLPVFDPACNNFCAISGDHKLVDILAYRREDSALARLITGHLLKLITLHNNHKSGKSDTVSDTSTLTNSNPTEVKE